MRIDHIHIEVDDLPAAVAFYRERLGLKPSLHEPHTAIFEVGEGTALVVDRAAPARPDDLRGAPRGVTIAIRAEPLDRKYAELRARGLEALEPPTERAWGERTFHVRDPEGYIFEFTEPAPPRRA